MKPKEFFDAVVRMREKQRGTSMKTKKCKRCEHEKPVTEFGPSSSSKDGLQSWCKDCLNEYNGLRDEWRHLGGVKYCRKCHEFKPRTEFNACSSHKDGLLSYCKVCDREHGRLRNGTTGEYRQPDSGTGLSIFTLQQLLDELKRRGYAGELTRTERIKL